MASDGASLAGIAFTAALVAAYTALPGVPMSHIQPILGHDQEIVHLDINDSRLGMVEPRPERAAYLATWIAGGFQVPSPGGRTDGGVSFGQYRRITR